jgi:hypothetical protein
MKYQPNEEALKPLTEALEEKRQNYLNFRKAAKKLYWLPFGLLVFCVLIALLYNTPLLLCVMFCFCLVLFIKFKKVDSYEEEYNNSYKETLIKPFVQLFYPKVTYLPGKFTTSNNIEASFLYNSLSFEQQLSCQDGFRGKTAEGLKFTLMEVNYRVEEHGNVKTQKEVFVSIDLPKKGYRPLVVAPGSIMTYTLERYNEKQIDEEPIVEQAEFEDYFEAKYKVYSQRAEDAAVLLTAPFLTLLQKLKKEWIGDIRFSFVNDILHIALPSEQDFFEGDLEQEVLPNTLGEELFNELSACLSVVDELNASLNQLELPSKERIPLPRDLDLSNENWDDSAYDHFIDN